MSETSYSECRSFIFKLPPPSIPGTSESQRREMRKNVKFHLVAGFDGGEEMSSRRNAVESSLRYIQSIKGISTVHTNEVPRKVKQKIRKNFATGKRGELNGSFSSCSHKLFHYFSFHFERTWKYFILESFFDHSRSSRSLSLNPDIGGAGKLFVATLALSKHLLNFVNSFTLLGDSRKEAWTCECEFSF